MGEVSELKRVEKIIDALEMRESTSSSFYDLCSELQNLLDVLPSKLGAISKADDDIKNRMASIINRLKKLETFATAQSDITSGLQKYIANPDK